MNYPTYKTYRENEIHTEEINIRAYQKLKESGDRELLLIVMEFLFEVLETF